MSIKVPEGLAGRTKKSAEYFKRATQVIPGGVSANIKYFAPYPLAMEKGKGSKLYDLDGNEYIDYLLCNGALIFGHGNQKINSAVTKQMQESGTAVFGTPHRLEAEMAETITTIFPSIEKVRFTNSGSEATLLAIRLAMAYSGKKKLAKFEGHYHGGYDRVLLSVNPELGEAGEEEHPQAIPDSMGVPDYYVRNTIILPFNDIKATESILRAHSEEIAGIIMEPVLGGFIPAEVEFMRELRKLTSELNILLIMDEVKTGFRLTIGGAQNLYDVEPDITTLGKVLGGGFPVGAVGGKKEIIDLLSPTHGADILSSGAASGTKNNVLFHSGTYNGHPVILAAGLATIHALEQPGVMDQLMTNTQLLRDKLEEVYAKHQIPMKTVGMGSIFNVVLTERAVQNYRDLKHANMNLREKIDYELLNLGIYTKPMTRYSMSCVHTIEDIERTAAAHDQALTYVEEQEK